MASALATGLEDRDCSLRPGRYFLRRHDLGLEAQIGDRFEHLIRPDFSRVVADRETVILQVDPDAFDSCEPFQGRFDPVGSAHSRRAAATLCHTAAYEGQELRGVLGNGSVLGDRRTRENRGQDGAREDQAGEDSTQNLDA